MIIIISTWNHTGLLIDLLSQVEYIYCGSSVTEIKRCVVPDIYDRIEMCSFSGTCCINSRHSLKRAEVAIAQHACTRSFVGGATNMIIIVALGSKDSEGWKLNLEAFVGGVTFSDVPPPNSSANECSWSAAEWQKGAETMKIIRIHQSILRWFYVPNRQWKRWLTHEFWKAIEWKNC